MLKKSGKVVYRQDFYHNGPIRCCFSAYHTFSAGRNKWEKLAGETVGYFYIST